MDKITAIRLYAHGARNYSIEVEWDSRLKTRIAPLTRSKARKLMVALEGMKDEG